MRWRMDSWDALDSSDPFRIRREAKNRHAGFGVAADMVQVFRDGMNR